MLIIHQHIPTHCHAEDFQQQPTPQKDAEPLSVEIDLFRDVGAAALVDSLVLIAKLPTIRS
jgi:hypothetical protein